MKNLPHIIVFIATMLALTTVAEARPVRFVEKLVAPTPTPTATPTP
jgi:hypothetical protein